LIFIFRKCSRMGQHEDGIICRIYKPMLPFPDSRFSLNAVASDSGFALKAEDRVGDVGFLKGGDFLRREAD
jgi:hypothetical protein